MQQRRLFRIVVSALSLLFAVGLLESLLAAFYPVPFALESNMYFEPDPYTGFRHQPLGEGYYAGAIAANANSQGNRDDPVAIPKPRDTVRVLVIGNSFTVGANVAQSEAYPQVLETLLAEQLQTPVEVVNAGTGGWIPFQYAQYFEHYGQVYDADLIVIGFFVGRDMYATARSVLDLPTAVLGRRVQPEFADSRVDYLRIWLYQNSNLARAVMNRGATEIIYARENCDEFSDFYLRLQSYRVYNHKAELEPNYVSDAKANVGQLRRIQDLGQANGAPMLVVIFPDELQINPALQEEFKDAVPHLKIDYAMPQTLLHDLLDERGIAYLDLTEPLRADPRCLYMNDTHWNAAGHELVAAQIRDYLVANYAKLFGRLE